MLYSIRGGKKSEKELVVKALWFAKDYLLPRHKNIEIDIELKKISAKTGNFLSTPSILEKYLKIWHKTLKIEIRLRG